MTKGKNAGQPGRKGEHMKKIIAMLLMLTLIASTMPGFAATTIDPTQDRGIVPQGQNAEGTWDVNPVIEGQNPVTGRPYDGDYIPIMINVDNVSAALPQWGIGDADLIYELPIDNGGMTRLMALYTSVYPDRVGPVRSARILHADMRQEWGAAWVFCGGQEAEGSNVFARIRELGLYDDDVNLAFNLQGQNGGSFNASRSSRKSPHHHQVKLDELYDFLAESGHTFTQRPFLFTDEAVEGDDAAKVIMNFDNGNSDSYYVYDESCNDYARYRTKTDKPYVDENDLESVLTYNNIIVQWTELGTYNGKKDRPKLTEVGEGNADFFMNGKHVAGYWVRSDINDRTVFFDSEGNEIELQRGETWIIVASPKFLEVTYE